MSAAEGFRETWGSPMPTERGILALDDMSHAESALLQTDVADYFMVAKENANAQTLGWADSVQRNRDLNYSLMADAKYHDTSRTMRSHVLAAVLTEPQFITVHTLADLEALKAAAEGRDEARTQLGGYTSTPETVGSLLGITVLTSHSEERCQALFGSSVKEKVMQLARLAVEANLEGIVCAGSDLGYLNKDPDTAKLIKVVPGIVLPGQEKGGGQQRTMSPWEAISEGADFLVAGSTVTKAPDRHEAAWQFVQEIEAAV